MRLPDGQVVRVTYAGQNGRPYVPIGRVLVDRGEMTLDQVSLQSHPRLAGRPPGPGGRRDGRKPVLRVLPRGAPTLRPDEGPPGALGVPLTPGRSLAVDRRFLPLGAPVLLATTDPLTGAPLQRLMLAQDLGGAIKGPVRADIFFGWGPEAEDAGGEDARRARHRIRAAAAAGGAAVAQATP